MRFTPGWLACNTTPANDANTKLLLHFDGPDGSTTIIDSSASAHTLSAVGTAALATAQSKFGSASCLIDNTGNNTQDNYVSSADDVDWSFGGGDWTIDTWMYPTAFHAGNIHQNLYSQRDDGLGNTFEFYLGISFGAFFCGLIINSGGVEIGRYQFITSTINSNAWTHFALVRSGSSVHLYKNGIRTTKVIYTDLGFGSIPDIAAILKVGGGSTESGLFGATMYLDEYRLSKGIARWTANFTPPAQPYS